jgi:hypothetical protein
MKNIPKFLLVAVFAALCTGCFSGPNLEVELLPNDMGAFFAIRITSIGSGDIEIQRVLANGSLEAQQYGKGFLGLEGVGNLPVKLSEGEEILMFNPVPWMKRTTRVAVTVDGIDYEYSF